MYVVTVNFRIHADRIEDFMPLMQAQARNSIAREAGCKVFDICTSEDDPADFFLYEVYEDRGAFDLHLASDHFRAFDMAVADMVAEKSAVTYRRI